MTERAKFFDDLAGVAGGALSALAGLRDEAESTIRARGEDVIRKLDLVKRDELEAVQEMAARARSGQEALEARVAALEAKLAGMMATASSHATASTSVPPPSPRPDSAEEPRPETPDLLAPKNTL